MAEPLRVCHIINTTWSGGAETMLYELLARLCGPRYDFQVISLLGEGPIAKRIARLGVPVHAVRLVRRGLPRPTGLIQAAQYLRAHRPHVIQTWMYHANLCGTLASQLAGRFPLVWSIHHSSHQAEFDTPNTLRSARWGARLSRRFPERVVLVSKAAWPVHARLGYDTARLHVIPNGFDVQKFRPSPSARQRVRRELQLDDECLLIGLIARWDPLKDHDNFLQAAARVAREIPGVRLLMAGQGVTRDNPQLVALLHRYGLEDRAYLLGARQDIPDVYAALDVAALSSKSEAFPLVVGEAMASGVPCAVTSVGDAAYMVGATGAVARPQDPPALAAALSTLCRLSPEQRSALGQQARQRIIENFNLQHVAERYGRLWHEIAGIRFLQQPAAEPARRAA